MINPIMEKDGVAYTIGILSIVLAFFQPLAGLVLGIVGLVQAKKQKTEMSSKAKKLNIIGIVLSIVVFIISVAITAYFASKGTQLPF